MTATPSSDHDLGVPTKVHSRDPETLIPVIEARVRARHPARRGLHVTGIGTPSGAGVNNETLLVDLAWEGGAGGTVLRIDTDDNLFLFPAFPDHFRLYGLMRETGAVPVPEVFGLETDLSVIGRPFFLMERMHGQVPSDQPIFHASGWMHDLAVADRAAMWREAVAAMVRIHAIPVEKATFLNRPALGRSGLEQEFDAALAYRAWALAGDSHRIIDAAALWLRDHFPEEPATGLAWGDARPQNIMYRDNRVVAIFDWDMASLGGAELDLAWWVQMEFGNTVSRGITRLEGWGSVAETLALWEELAGRTLRDMEWHHVFAAFRAAIIVMRLAKNLKAKGLLPPQSADWEQNNLGVQYLASLLTLEPLSPDSAVWPGVR